MPQLPKKDLTIKEIRSLQFQLQEDLHALITKFVSETDVELNGSFFGKIFTDTVIVIEYNNPF